MRRTFTRIFKYKIYVRNKYLGSFCSFLAYNMKTFVYLHVFLLFVFEEDKIKACMQRKAHLVIISSFSFVLYLWFTFILNAKIFSFSDNPHRNINKRQNNSSNTKRHHQSGVSIFCYCNLNLFCIRKNKSYLSAIIHWFVRIKCMKC
jgi:hypothetical protein